MCFTNIRRLKRRNANESDKKTKNEKKSTSFIKTRSNIENEIIELELNSSKEKHKSKNYRKSNRKKTKRNKKIKEENDEIIEELSE